MPRVRCADNDKVNRILPFRLFFCPFLIIIVSSFLIDMIDIGSQLMIFRYDREGPGNKSDSLVEGERLAVNFSDKGFNITADPSLGNHSFHNCFSF